MSSGKARRSGGKSARGVLLADVIAILEAMAPADLAEPWDNVGIQIGDRQAAVKAVRVALDPSPGVIDAACREGVDLLVTHHPLFFKPLKKIDLRTAMGRSVAQALRHGLAVFALHTNLDAVAGGLNDWLAERLELTRIRRLKEAAEAPGTPHGIGRVGDLRRPMRLEELARFVKKKLDLELLRMAGAPGLEVRRVAVCTGSGGSILEAFAASGAEAFVSGDLRHHDAMDAAAAGLGLIDVGHYSSEQLMKSAVAGRLEKEFRSRRMAVAVKACTVERDPFVYI
jgi:dinuclear metal center YbgI/SA1388 family protein